MTATTMMAIVWAFIDDPFEGRTGRAADSAMASGREVPVRTVTPNTTYERPTRL